MKKIFNYFTKFEIFLWAVSVCMITVSFVLFDKENYLNFIASLIGITSLIFIAKGNPIGQLSMVFFGLTYGIISYSFAYYGEMITYLGLTMPMAIVALITWLKNPYKGNKAQVKISSISKKEFLFLCVLTIAVTFAFYFILSSLGTANIVPSTISVATSFFAVYLTFRRSPFFALAYATNDVVLMVLWALASTVNIQYLSVVICFGAFLFNDLYTFINWQRLKKRQAE